MKYIILIILALVTANVSIAQEGYADGYYIPYGGDKAFAPIKLLNSSGGRKIGYLNHKGRKKKFTADEVSEYGIKGLSSYASVVPVSEKTKPRFFAEIVVDGQVRLMYYAFKKQYYIRRKGSVETVKINKKGFKKQMMDFFQDFDDLHRDIKKKRIKYEQLETAVSRYNTWYAEFYSHHK